MSDDVTIPSTEGIPIVVGWHYRMYPANSSNWVEVVSVADREVTVRGLENTIAAWSVPVWKFNDLIVDYKVRGSLILTESGFFILESESGLDLLGS